MVRVEIKEMQRVFADGTRVGPINLTIEDGELVTLLGPSGSGKTTTLKMIAGLIHPVEGILLFDGIDMSNVPPRERGIGMVVQSVALFPNMSVFQNIAFSLDVSRTPQQEVVKRVEELANIVGIRHLLLRRTNEISGGEGQRVALARALASKPKLLLLDEPLSALDPQLRERLQEEIRTVQKHLGVTTVYVTHSQDEAFAISDRIAVLKDGHVVQVSTPEEIFKSPHSEFVARFIGGGNILRGKVAEATGNLLTVELEGTPVKISGAAEPGEVIEFTIKPDQITLYEEPAQNCVSGKISTLIRQVGETKVTVDLGQQEVVCYVTNARDGPALTVGTPIYLSFEPADAIRLVP
jgi:ABC-type Fe3+/spermidine/putrescine transport system ATPase subunit